MGDARGLWVAGGSGLMDEDLIERLQKGRDVEVLAPKQARLHRVDCAAVTPTLQISQPETAVPAAANIGGIAANLSDPVTFLREKLSSPSNIMTHAVREKGRKVRRQ